MIKNKLLPLGNFTKTCIMFKTYKQYKNGGKVLIYSGVNRNKSDFKDLVTIANAFAQKGEVVVINPTVHFKSDEYKQFFGLLIGTIYERKCPDLKIGNLFYEYESFIPPFRKKKISGMITKGTKQSSRIIINNTKGASDRYINSLIYERINNADFIADIQEVWLYEKGKLRLLFKKQ